LPHRARSADERDQVQAKLTLADLTDLVVDLPIVGLAPRSDAFGYGTPTKVVFITRQTRIAGAVQNPESSGCEKLWA
jgi:hypothetical protein